MGSRGKRVSTGMVMALALGVSGIAACTGDDDDEVTTTTMIAARHPSSLRACYYPSPGHPGRECFSSTNCPGCGRCIVVNLCGAPCITGVTPAMVIPTDSELRELEPHARGAPEKCRRLRPER